MLENEDSLALWGGVGLAGVSPPVPGIRPSIQGTGKLDLDSRPSEECVAWPVFTVADNCAVNAAQIRSHAAH